ncbi:MAG: nitroreductase/quinone reductase family protein [Chloroflexota bacterium]
MSDKRNTPPALFRWLIKAQNPFMKWLLQSPFHLFVSNFYMLLTVTGRKSGTQYKIPVQYAEGDNTLYVITSEGYTWWKNLRGGAEVAVLMRGNKHTGWATTHKDIATIREAFTMLYPKMTDQQQADFVAGKVAIHIAL